MAHIKFKIRVGGKKRKHRKMRLRAIGPVSEQKVVGPAVTELGQVPGRRLTRPMRGSKMAVQVFTDTQEVDAAYDGPKDKKGFPAKVQAGSLVWNSTDETVAVGSAISQDPDTGKITGTFKAGAPGVAEVWPSADADLGDGVRTIEGERIAVQVTSGEAAGLGSVALGTPREQA